MAVDYPFFTDEFEPVQFQWGAMPRTLVLESVLNGSIQTQGMPGKRWTCSMTLKPTNPRQDGLARRARVEAYFDALNGQQERVNLWHFGRLGLGGRRGFPMGNIATSGVQVNANAAQFATSLVLKNCGAGTSAEAGDMLKVGNQLFMIPVRAVADGSGIMTVGVTGGLRVAVLANASVTTVRPTAQFVLATPDWRASYDPHHSAEFAIDFMEVFQQ